MIASENSMMDILQILFSHHSDRFKEEDLTLSENVVFKTDVRQLKAHSVEFVDGSEEDIDALVYCTGK